MAKHSHRERILTEGLRVVHQRGFAGASVRDIVQAAEVPQGSFTNHFVSKEAFGLEIIELYFSSTRRLIDATLRNDTLAPLQRLRSYLDANIGRLAQDAARSGCLFGNFTAEASDHSEPIRTRLVAIFAQIQEAFAYCLRAAVEAEQLPLDYPCDEIAGFIVSSLQGATLLAKAERSDAPLERLRDVLFAKVLR